jgi:K+-sensing histidine kinase KdpD
MPPAGQRRGKYLGFVAHEIKNPLATALWSCDLLKRMEGADRSGPRAEKMIDVSLRALRRMRRLIDDYFMIERLQENGYDLRRENVSLKDLVSGAVEALGEKDGIKVDGWGTDIADVMLQGDADMLRRCFRLLFEHMARGGADPKLTLLGHHSGATCTLLVRAEAPPAPLVPPDPEERLSGDTTGAVLGYALAEHILAVHAGKIEERDGALLVTLPAA